MNIKTIFALTAVVIFVAAAALTLNSIALHATDRGYAYFKAQNKPYYLKGRILKDCFDDTTECSLVVW
jgi:hypothetical protein